MKHVRLGINGFGRIGRIATRIAWEREGVKIVAINSRSFAESHAYLLKHDSTYGIFPHEIKVKRGNLYIERNKIHVWRESEPRRIPWREAKVDIVLEATGVFRTIPDAKQHLSAGAKRVIVTAPPKDTIPTFCMGVNHKQYNPSIHLVISNASCTTNCLATVAKVLQEELGIIRGYMTTIHAYTDSQNLMDNSSKKSLRLARSAPNNVIPTSTGASKALGLVLPELEGKIISSALRVPIASGSLIDLVVEVNKKVKNANTVNKLFEKAQRTDLKKILTITYEPIVSSDIHHPKFSSFSAIVDGLSTTVMGNLIHIKAWYDNEWGYASRLIDLCRFISNGL